MQFALTVKNQMMEDKHYECRYHTGIGYKGKELPRQNRYFSKTNFHPQRQYSSYGQIRSYCKRKPNRLPHPSSRSGRLNRLHSTYKLKGLHGVKKMRSRKQQVE